MSGHFNTVGNKGFLKTQYTKNKLVGEKLMAFEFEMTVKGYPLWSVLIRTAQMPALGRADVEDFGAGGLKFVQHGALENSVEMTVTCVESLTGTVIQDLRDIIANKEYVDITMRSNAESTMGVSGRGHEFDLLDCKLRSDAIEFSTEDQALVKPSITIVSNFIDL